MMKRQLISFQYQSYLIMSLSPPNQNMYLSLHFMLRKQLETPSQSKKSRFLSENRILPFIDEENRKLQQLIKLNEEKKRQIDKMLNQKQDIFLINERHQQSIPALLTLSTIDQNQLKSIKKMIKNNPILAKSIETYALGQEQIVSKIFNRLVGDIDIYNKYRRESRRQSRSEGVMNKKQQLKIKEPLPPLPENKSQEKSQKPIDYKNFTNFSNLMPNSGIHQSAIPQVQVSKQPSEGKRNQDNIKLTYFVGPGNNDPLVRKIMKERHPYWSEVAYTSNLVNMKWQQTYQGYQYNRLQGDSQFQYREVYNLFEYHKELTTKTGMVKNLLKAFEFNVQRVFNMVPFCYTLNLEERNWEGDLGSFAEYFKANLPEKLRHSEQKDKMTLSQQLKIQFSSPYKYLSPAEEIILDKNMKQFKLQDTLLSDDSYLWILKPADWNQGDGIFVFTSLKDLEDLLFNFYNGWYSKTYSQMEPPRRQTEDTISSQNSKKPANSKGIFLKCRQFVIQKYIEKPFLIRGRKFDIRIWALMTHQMQFFIFKEGYIRTSSEQFDLLDINPFIHLTNNSVQEHNKNYQVHEQGNQLSFDEFQYYLEQFIIQYDKRSEKIKVDFRKEILPKIKEMVTTTVYSCRKLLNKLNRKYCFQLFGYDIILDKNFKPWLIEINTNPGIDETTPHLSMLLARLLNDTFKMTIDIIFPRVYNFPPLISDFKKVEGKVDYNEYLQKQGQGRFPVVNYPDNILMWEYLGQY